MKNLPAYDEVFSGINKNLITLFKQLYGVEPNGATQKQRLHFLSILMAWAAEATEECADITSGDSE